MNDNDNELIVVRDERVEYEAYTDEDGYSYGHETSGDLVTQATGTLRDMVLAKVGNTNPEAEVTIIEHNWNSGYCETCSYPETDFKITVDGAVVFDTQSGDGNYWRAKYEANPYTTFGVLQWWLTCGDEKEED